MQYIVYDPNWNPAAAPPPPSEEFIAQMGRFIGEAMQAGSLVTTGGRCHPRRAPPSPKASSP